MKRLLILSFLLLLVGCQNTNITITETENSSSASQESIENHDNSTNSVNYSVYSSLLHAYDKAIRLPTGELNGLLYTNLVDFDNNGILELVVARVYNGSYDDEFSYMSYGHEDFIGSYDNPAIKIFTLDENNGAKFIDEFPLVYYAEEGISLDIGYKLNEDGTTSLITDDYGDNYDYTNVFWNFDGEYFNKTRTLSVNLSPAIGEHIYYLDTLEIIEEKYNTYYSDTIFHAIAAQGFEIVYEKITAETLDFLKDFPKEDSIGESAVFHDGFFVIFEDTIDTHEEQLVSSYFKAQVLNDYDKIAEISANPENAEILKNVKEVGSVFAGNIIENFDTIPFAYVGAESITLEQELYMTDDVDISSNPEIVGMYVRNVVDYDISYFTGQFGPLNKYWYLIDGAENVHDMKISDYFSDSWHDKELDNAFYVQYFGSYDDLFDIFGYELPDFSFFLTSEEQGEVEYFSTENPTDMFLIKNIRGNNLKVYDYSDNSERGELLYETTHSILYFGCTADYMNSDIEIVSEIYEGPEVSYIPSIIEDNADLGYFGAHFPYLDNIAQTDYLNILIETIGEDYLNGRSAMQIESEMIFNELCTVYAIGTNTDEKFTTEEFLAVSDIGNVYWYEPIYGEWYGWSQQN